MPEKITPMQSVQIDYVCDECGIGVFHALGTTLLTYPPKYPHKCTHCNAQKTFLEIYPHIDYVLMQENG